MPLEPQGEIVHPNVSSTSEDEEPILEAISDSSSNVQSVLSSTSLVAGSHIDPVNEQSAGASVSLSDNDNDNDDNDNDNDDNYVWNHRDEWVSESARQEGQILITYSRASLSLELPSLHSLRMAKQKQLSRFQSNDPILVKSPLYHPPLPILPALPSAFRVS